MTAQNLWQRNIVFATGLVVGGFGIAMTAVSGLGTTPVSSLPLVLAGIVPLTLGMLTFIFNLIYLAGQRMIWGREFPKFQYLQIPASLVLGIFIDIGVWIFAPLMGEGAGWQWLFLIAGSIVLACGIVCQLVADIILVPGEGLVKVIAHHCRGSFGTVKILFDLTVVFAAVVTGLAGMGKIYGVREGTLVSALLVGFLVKILLPHSGFLIRFCCHMPYCAKGKCLLHYK